MLYINTHTHTYRYNIYIYITYMTFYICIYNAHIYMEFRKTIMRSLHAGQQRRHKCEEWTFGLSGRRRGWVIWENGTETCITICETDDQCRFGAWFRAPKAGALGHPRRVGCGGMWERGSGLGGHMSTCDWFILRYAKPSQYCKVNILQLK